MEKRLIQITLVFLISFFIPALSAYLGYYDLRETDFLSCDICFENSDQDNLLIDQGNESKVILSSASSIMKCLPEIDFLEHFPLFSFLTYSLGQKTFILLC